MRFSSRPQSSQAERLRKTLTNTSHIRTGHVSQSNRKMGLPLRRKSSIKKAIFALTHKKGRSVGCMPCRYLAHASKCHRGADLLTNAESKIPLAVKPKQTAPCGWNANRVFSWDGLAGLAASGMVKLAGGRKTRETRAPTGFTSSRHPRSSHLARNLLKPWPSIQARNLRDTRPPQEV